MHLISLSELPLKTARNNESSERRRNLFNKNSELKDTKRLLYTRGQLQIQVI